MTGGKRGGWSTHELERLKVLYPRCPEARVAALLRRSVESVRRRARTVFGRPSRRGPWTAEEDLVVREAWGVLDVGRLSLVLARPERDVAARVDQLRDQRRRGGWSSAERAMLKQLYGSRSDDALEVCLSRPQAQIRRMARELCLRKDKRFSEPDAPPARMPRWTDPELAVLDRLYPDHDNLAIARQLGRSVASIANKAHQLGLHKNPEILRELGRRNVAERYRR